MAKRAQRTRVLVGDIDISEQVYRVNITREADYPDVAEIVLFPDSLAIDKDGVLVIAIVTEEDES